MIKLISLFPSIISTDYEPKFKRFAKDLGTVHGICIKLTAQMVKRAYGNKTIHIRARHYAASVHKTCSCKMAVLFGQGKAVST